MTPTILDVAETRIKSETARVVNEAVCLAFLSEHTDYSELVNIEKNTDNEIIMISANKFFGKYFGAQYCDAVAEKINELASFDVNIPLGTLSGIPLFAEKGPKINIVVSPIGVVNCNFTSSFETAGINQTLHRIYINVLSKVDIIIPTAHTTVETSTPILICESVIIGKVPQTFLQGGLLLGSS